MTKMPELSDEEMRMLEAVCDYFYDSNLDGEVIVFNEAGVGCGLGLNEAHDYLFSIYHKARAQRELLKGWIPMPTEERLGEIMAKARGLPSPEERTVLRLLQQEHE